jgi:hypothetical protein
MNGDSSNREQTRDVEDVIDESPESKHGDEGESANEGRQAGPNSARAGQPIAPQTGDPMSRDRRPN